MRDKWVVLVLAIAASSSVYSAECNLQRFADLPVTMQGTRPLVTGSINGSNALFLIDSGATFSVLSREAADKFKLKLGPPLQIRGTGGTTMGNVTTAKSFSLVGMQNGRVFRDVDFIVNGVSETYGRGTDGLIGQNVFGQADMEFDLANGFIRLFVEKDCGSRSLAYWHGNADVAVMDIRRLESTGHHIVGEATLNGQKIRVVFDSGAARSILTLRAAARAGIKPDQENVKALGVGRGIGSKGNETSLARFEILDLGGEKIKNAQLQLGDILIGDLGDMLLGADFFLSHRIFVSGKQSKVYFTYNGGRVFDLGIPEKPKQAVTATSNEPISPTSDATPSSVAISQSPNDAGSPSDSSSNSPSDASGLVRRGAAYAGRMEFTKAVADFDAAIKLDANNPETYFQRGMANLQLRQGRQSLADFDQTLKLKPDHTAALVQRGAVRLAMKNPSDAAADFDAAVGTAPNDAGLALQIAEIYAQNRQFDEALRRLNQWVEKFPKDERIAKALDDRCRVRTVAGSDLDLALEDCNAALKKGNRTSLGFDSRGLVNLRRGDADKAIADFNSSLKLQPKNPLTLYVLGIAQLKKGLKIEGDKNIQAAVAIAPTIPDYFKRMNLDPRAMD